MPKAKTKPKPSPNPSSDLVASTAPTGPIENHARTHSFAYGKGRYAACECGVEEDLMEREGKLVRLYRAPGGEWSEGAAMCPKYVAPPPAAAPPTPVFLFDDEVIDGAKVADYAAMVELDIAYSPVLPLPGEEKPDGVFGPGVYHWNTPVEVTPTQGGSYMLAPTDRLGNPTLARAYPLLVAEGTVSPETLKVWRARYLLRRGAWAKKVHTLPNGERQQVAHAFDLGAVLAMGDSPLGKLLRGAVKAIEIRDGGE